MQRIMRLIVTAIGLSFAVSGQANAQQSATKYFSYAIDSFYEADYSNAVRYLDRAESLGMKDARMYLYRGVAKIRSGKDESGRADLKIGAEREAKYGTRYVGRFLQRLDGAENEALERSRSQARLALYKQSEENESEAIGPAERTPIASVENRVTLSEDSTDPFVSDSLGIGEISAVAAVVARDEFGNEEDPDDNLVVGSEAFPEDETGLDDFGADAADDAAMANAAEAGDGFGFGDDSGGSTPPKKRGIFGSIISALGKSASPAKAIGSVTSQLPPGTIPGLPGGGPPGGPGGPPPGFGGGDFGGGDFEDGDFGADDMESGDMEGDAGDFGDFESDMSDDEMSDDDGNPFEDDF